MPKEALGREPLRAAFLALFPEKEAWLKAERRVLMGRDLLKLGLKPGPKVGRFCAGWPRPAGGGGAEL